MGNFIADARVPPATMWSTLVSASELHDALPRGSIRLLDCRHQLTDPGYGPRAYGLGHIEGAVHAHIDRDLSGPVGSTTGRHPLPDAIAFRATCSRWGIDPTVQVVAYDDAGGQWAARAWWLLKDFGHEAVAVLDGGLQAWEGAGFPLSTKPPMIKPTVFQGTPRHRPRIDASDLLTSLAYQRFLLLDARAPDRYRGDVEPIDSVAGHIPTARNSPAAAHLRPNGTFLSPIELRTHFNRISTSFRGADIVAYCGSGVTGCHILLALEHADLGPGRLYPGSWSEWIRDTARPVARGPEPGSAPIK